MRFQPFGLALASSLAVVSVASAADASAGFSGSAEVRQLQLSKRDGHHHAVAPLLELNETEVTLNHQPTPPSYYTIDWEDPEQASARHPGLIIVHSIFMSLAFFIFLPIGIALRSVKHSLHGVAVLAFYASCVLACAASSVYRKLTPDMYPNASHARHGYSVLVVALALSFIDALGAIQRIVNVVRSEKHYTLKGFWKAVFGREDSDTKGPESIGLIGAELESESNEDGKKQHHSYDDPDPVHDFNHGNAEQWANHVRLNATMSDGTLFGPASPHSDETLHDIHFAPRISLLRRIAGAAFAATERALVFAGFGLFLTGIVIYTGGCRQKYVNGCLAHLIKGGIFWSYGLVTFARFLGWCSELGWSWNRAPASGYPTAEFVESFLFFLYGVTNTWMERFGANPGDPYTTKQIQHIGIAIMFWFAGLVGMAVESKTIRKWLAALAVDTSSKTVAEPVTYTSSFNPFPALVIGVTGSVMAAHFQTYLFQVQIHTLWGNLLLAFSVLRCLTYFFLWVAPPQSTLPSRPPTEALGSFFLACGGISFMFSTEEVTIAAMRRGRDDIMLFAVVAVAITCLAFCWTICVFAFQGWLKTRSKRAVSYHNIA
ncbi:cytoplasmic protein [Mycena epipterygia]|nr:cytoplasmic protein [Mycena epipterygia]